MKPESRIQNPESCERAFISLGSNLGDSRKIILDANARLQEFSDEPILKSSLWQTTPVNCPPNSPMFVNAVIGLVLRTRESVESLFEKIQALEKEFGRKPKKVLNEPRPLDLDLIAFGIEVRAADDLKVPHPRAHLRGFVLQPLSEIAPELILPGQGKSVVELLRGLHSKELLLKLPESTA